MPPMPSIPEDAPADFPSAAPSEKIAWTFDTAIDAVQSVNLVSVAHYVNKIHHCEPHFFPSSQHDTEHPSNQFFVLMDYTWPPRLNEGIYGSIQDVRAALPDGFLDPKEFFLREFPTLDEAVGYFKGSCPTVHEEGINLVEEGNAIRFDQARDKTQGILNDLKAHLFGLELHKSFPLIVEKPGYPKAWVNFKGVEHARASLATKPGDRCEKAMFVIPASSYHNNWISKEYQRVNGKPRLGSLPPDILDDPEPEIPWEGWNFWVMTPEKEDMYAKL
ncbi:hypothetical protein VNI00_018903 [Paramarasmius palmivorus]|uniref:Uncharacterized protein n=1 Tax=Paramarasmius palmivorus TaxID=297713 RepID=A0AAW0AT83_9AGAR